MNYRLVDPDSVLTFQFDWSDWLAPGSPGDSIVSRQWSISPLNGTSPETPTLQDDTTATVKVSGLRLGWIYHLVERVTTTNGLIDDRTIVLRCEDR